MLCVHLCSLSLLRYTVHTHIGHTLSPQVSCAHTHRTYSLSPQVHCAHTHRTPEEREYVLCVCTVYTMFPLSPQVPSGTLCTVYTMFPLSPQVPSGTLCTHTSDVIGFSTTSVAHPPHDMCAHCGSNTHNHFLSSSCHANSQLQFHPSVKGPFHSSDCSNVRSTCHNHVLYAWTNSITYGGRATL